MTDYRATIQAIPELAYWLADRITPTNTPSDGIRPSGHRADAASASALDDLNTLTVELTESIRFWQAAFDDLDRAPVTTAPTCSHSPATAVATVQPHVQWLLDNWELAAGHPFHEWWCESLDEWLVPMVKRMQREGKRQHPRRCQLCGTISVWADLDHATGLCDQCGHVHRAEIWITVKEAALMLGVDRSTINRWITSDRIAYRTKGIHKYVEIGECREQLELNLARKKLNLPNAHLDVIASDA